MPLLLNLRSLERNDAVLQGELSAVELDIESLDELISAAGPLEHDFTVQKMEDGILVRGWWRLELDCECSRCLKRFKDALEFDDWACHIPLEGEEAASIKDDSVDLTPYLREDILLELPQRPLCKPECPGLPTKVAAKSQNSAQSGQSDGKKDPWAELNKLKF